MEIQNHPFEGLIPDFQIPREKITEIIENKFNLNENLG